MFISKAQVEAPTYDNREVQPRPCPFGRLCCAISGASDFFIYQIRFISCTEDIILPHIFGKPFTCKLIEHSVARF